MKKFARQKCIVFVFVLVFGIMASQFFVGKQLVFVPTLPKANIQVATTTSELVVYTPQLVVVDNNKNTLQTYAVQDDIAKQLEKVLNEQLGYLDLKNMEEIIKNLSQEGKAIFGSASALDKLQSILNGDFKLLGKDALQAFLNLFFQSFITLIPLMASVVAVGILSGMLNHVRSGTTGKNLGDVIQFVCYGMVLVLIVSSVYKLLEQTGKTLAILKGQIDAIFPILLTLLTAVGGNVSVSVYQPAIGLLSGSILQIFNSVLMPIFIFSFVFSIIANFSTTIRLEKFSAFLSSLFKWIVGVIFTVFIAFISVQGITAGAMDGVSVKTAKFAMKSYIPILGGYLADGFQVIMASSILIKNAIGLCGLLLVFSTVLAPILNIVIFGLFLKLTAAILEPLTDGRISNFLFGVSKNLTMLVAILIGVSFMFVILTSLIMCSANFV